MVKHIKYELHRLTKQDAQEIVQLSAIIGWDYTIADVKTILDAGYVVGHKTEYGQLISSAAIFPYGEHQFCWASLGMVIVHPDYRGLGLGKKVTQACLSFAQKSPVMLVATEEGIPLYESLGFVEAGRLHKMIAEKSQIPRARTHTEATYRCRAYQETDFDQVVHLDAQAFGASRITFLQSRMKQAKKQAILVNEKNEIAGFALGIELHDMLLIGPLVAPDPIAAELLVQAVLEQHSGRARIDLPFEKQELVDVLKKQYGFEVVNQPPVMVIHSLELPCRNGSLYGIAAQAFG